MSGTTTAFCSSAKVELLEGYHSFLATQSGLSGTTANTVFTITSLASTAGLVAGMAVTGTGGIAASSVIATIDSGTQVTMSKAATATSSAIAFTADVFKLALVKVTPTGTYGAATTNYTNLTGNSDEVSGTGYTATGVALGNVTPVIDSTTSGVVNFSPNPSWTTATFSTTGAILYNSTALRSGTGGRAVGVLDFAGTQSVTSGTFTVVMPSATAAAAIVRIN